MGNRHIDAPVGLPQGTHLGRQRFRRHLDALIRQFQAQLVRHGLVNLRRNAVAQLRPQ